MNPVALITGAAGFMGRHLARHLRESLGAQVVGVGRRSLPADSLPADSLPADSLPADSLPADSQPLGEYVALDLLDPAPIAQLLRRVRPDYVFHLAGVRGPAADTYRGNFLGGIHLLEAVRHEAPAARVVVVGSAAEYGRAATSDMPLREESPCCPGDAYGASKLALTIAAQTYAREHGLRIVVARPFNVLGAGISESLVVGAILQRVRTAVRDPEQTAIPVGNLETERDFIAVEDVVEGLVKLARGEAWGEVFNLCSGQSVCVKQVAERILACAPRTLRLEADARLFRPADVPIAYGSYAKARRTVGFCPRIAWEESIRRAWDHATGDAA